MFREVEFIIGSILFLYRPPEADPLYLLLLYITHITGPSWGATTPMQSSAKEGLAPLSVPPSHSLLVSSD